ncbi:hypothetical protein Asp14428_11530 [Actinoplanes sp. NBRC 14428]|nr:hypothetical protein Asp14428_11530 [Actinoplanes sp. NBRC 14428]
MSPFVGGDYYGAIISGIAAAAAAGGDRIMAVQTLDPGSHSADRAGVPDFRYAVARRHLAGLVVLPGAVPPGYARRARQAGMPVIYVGEDATGHDCSSVLVDNRSGVREAVAHLVEHGHRRIAFAGNLAHFDLRERYEGYLEGLRAAGLTPQTSLLYETDDNHESGGAAVADALIRARMPATAIVLGTDRNAIGLAGRLAAAGYAVPGDMAVAGFDDIADATFARPGISTVRQPLDDVGAAVYELMLELQRDADPAPVLRHVPTTFVARASCGCGDGSLPVSEEATRALFGQVQYLQETLNIQHQLGIELLGAHDRDPRTLAWLGSTPAIGGSLGLWTEPDPDRDDPPLDVVGEYGGTGAGRLAGSTPASGFPPPWLFELADAEPGNAVFVVPVRGGARDWGFLAAVGRIQATTPPGREMMNQSGALLAAALEHRAMVAALREKEESLRNAALHDHLTGLPNRVLLEDRLNQAHLRAARQPDRRFAVLLLDLDGFKAVNDSYGHAAGDELLVEVAVRLTRLLRRSDTVARLGGDEFVVLLDGVAGPHGHQPVCDGITASIAEPFAVAGHKVHVGVSIGVALSRGDGTPPDHLLREADAAMYEAKSLTRRR